MSNPFEGEIGRLGGQQRPGLMQPIIPMYREGDTQFGSRDPRSRSSKWARALGLLDSSKTPLTAPSPSLETATDAQQSNQCQYQAACEYTGSSDHNRLSGRTPNGPASAPD